MSMTTTTVVPEIEALYATGHWLLERERPADALHVFRTMVAAAPDDERSWLGLTRSHESLGELAIARELHFLAERAAPKSFRCPLARARFLRRHGDEDGASFAYDLSEARALALDSSLDGSAEGEEIARAIVRERDGLA